MDPIKNVKELRAALQSLLDINGFKGWTAAAYCDVNTHREGQIDIYYSGQVNLGSTHNICLFNLLKDYEQIMQDIRLGNITLPDNMGE